MRRRSLALAAVLALCLSGCGGPAGESAPPAETGTPAPSVSPVSPSVTPAPKPAPAGVYTDWSKLEPYQSAEPLYTRWYDEPVDRLRAVEGGYGAKLIGFVGASSSVLGTWMGTWDVSLYGLATPEGVVVCEPVYEQVYTPSLYRGGKRDYLDAFLVLGRTKAWEVQGETPEDGTWMSGGTRYTVAASDGRWVLPEEYAGVWPLSEGKLLLMDEAEALWLCGEDGVPERSPVAVRPSEVWEPSWRAEGFGGGFSDGIGVWTAPGDGDYGGNGCTLIDARTGLVRALPDVSWCYSDWYGGEELAVANQRDTDLTGYLDRTGEWAIAPQFRWAYSFEGGYAAVEPERDGGDVLIDRSGAVVVRTEGRFLRVWGRDGEAYYLVLAEDDALLEIYDSACRPVTDHPMLDGQGASYTYTGTLVDRDGGTVTIWDAGGTLLATVETDAEPSWYHDGRLEFQDGESVGIYDCDAGRWAVPLGRYESATALTDGEHTICWGQRGGECCILDEDGVELARADEVDGFSDGVIRTRSGGMCRWLDLEGETVFCWPLIGSND